MTLIISYMYKKIEIYSVYWCLVFYSCKTVRWEKNQRGPKTPPDPKHVRGPMMVG